MYELPGSGYLDFAEQFKIINAMHPNKQEHSVYLILHLKKL